MPDAHTDVSVFLPDLSGAGAEQVAIRLAEGMADRGLSVDLVVANASGALAGSISDYVTVVDLDASRMTTALPALVTYLRNSRPAVLLSHIWHANTHAVLASSIARTGTRVVLVEHNTLSVRMGPQSSRRERWFAAPSMRLAYRFADGRVAVSDGVARDLVTTLGRGIGPVIALPNPVITPAFVEMSRATLTHPLVAPSAPPLVLGVGRLVAQKRFDRLIRAFAAADREANLVILGEGPLREQLARQVEESGLTGRVHFLGFVGNPAAWLGHAAGLVLSSDHEGLPTVLIEALAVGLPVVATDCPSGPREILAGGRHGRLVPVNDEDALRVGIADLLDGHINPSPHAADRYRVEDAVTSYLELLFPEGWSPTHAGTGQLT